MRILFVSTYPPSACGIAEYSYDLADGILRVEPKAEVEVLKLNTLREVPAEGYDFSKARSIDTGEYAGSVNYGRLLKLLDGRYDVIHVQHEYGIFPKDLKFLKFLKLLRKYCDKLVITMHTVRRSGWYPDVAKYQRKLAKLVDHVVVHSVVQEVELLHQGVDTNKVFVIPHGTRLLELPSRDVVVVEELELSIGVKDRVVLIQGFLRKDKGVHVALEAFGKVLKYVDDVILLVAGGAQGLENGRYVEGLTSKISSLKGRVVLLNKYLSRREIALVYSLADLVLFPYVDVGGDLSISGALHVAFGSFKPLICARTPRLVECYERAPALSFPSNNSELLAKRLAMALNYYDYVLDYSKPIVEYAISTSWANVARLHIKLYKDGDPYDADVANFAALRPELSRRDCVGEMLLY